MIDLPKLTIPKAEIAQRIHDQIEQGKNIKDMIGKSPAIASEVIDEANRAKSKWVDFTEYILKTSFDNDTFAQEFIKSSYSGSSAALNYRIRLFKRSMDSSITKLESITDRVEQMPELQEQVPAQASDQSTLGRKEKTERWSQNRNIQAAIIGPIIAAILGLISYQYYQYDKNKLHEIPYVKIDSEIMGNYIYVNLVNPKDYAAEDVSLRMVFIDEDLKENPEVYDFDDFANGIQGQADDSRSVRLHFGRKIRYLIIATKYVNPIINKELYQDWIFIESDQYIDSQVPQTKKQEILSNPSIDSLLTDFKLLDGPE